MECAFTLKKKKKKKAAFVLLIPLFVYGKASCAAYWQWNNFLDQNGLYILNSAEFSTILCMLVFINYTLKIACNSGERNFLTKQKVTSKYLPQKIVLVGSWKHSVQSTSVSTENHFGILLYWFLASVISKSADFKVTWTKLSILNPACLFSSKYIWKFLV